MVIEKAFITLLVCRKLQPTGSPSLLSPSGPSCSFLCSISHVKWIAST